MHMAFWKASMINRWSNIINRNRSARKISQVLCSTYDPTKIMQNCEHAFDSLLNSGHAMHWEITRLVHFVVLTWIHHPLTVLAFIIQTCSWLQHNIFFWVAFVFSLSSVLTQVFDNINSSAPAKFEQDSRSKTNFTLFRSFETLIEKLCPCLRKSFS